jgi:hypothetical protein
MKRNGDVMRSDRLKQVMQDIDPGFDEKNVGASKFSRFVQQAQERGLLSVTKLENGQLEIGLPQNGAERTSALPELQPVEEERTAAPIDGVAAPQREPAESPEEREDRGRRSRRGRGRGRGRDREERGRAPATSPSPTDLPARLTLAEEPPASEPETIGVSGERLTRNEAFDIVRRAVETLTTDDDDTTRASAVRQRAREILGRDRESLNERMFIRILKDAHDAGVVDLRRRGDDFEVARAAEALPVADQVARADAAAAPPRPSLGAGAPRIGMGPRGAGGRGRGRLDGPPPELLALGVVAEPALTTATAAPSLARNVQEASVPPESVPAIAAAEPDIAPNEPKPTPRKRSRRGTPTSVERQAAPAPEVAPPAEVPAPSPRKSRARTAAKTAHRRARKRSTPKNES